MTHNKYILTNNNHLSMLSFLSILWVISSFLISSPYSSQLLSLILRFTFFNLKNSDERLWNILRNDFITLQWVITTQFQKCGYFCFHSINSYPFGMSLSSPNCSNTILWLKRLLYSYVQWENEQFIKIIFRFFSDKFPRQTFDWGINIYNEGEKCANLKCVDKLIPTDGRESERKNDKERERST